MPTEESEDIVILRSEFYRDGFFKMLLALVMVILAIILLLVVAFGLFIQRPDPVTFAVDNEWRVLPPVALDKPYLKTFDMLQWVSNTLPLAFTYDFVNYTSQQQSLTTHFTENGWKKYLEIINAYASNDTVSQAKLFVNSSAAGAPIVINDGVLGGRYIWWVQMPLKISYSNYQKGYERTITFQVLVVRVSTLDNLSGVAIENIIVAKEGG